MKKRITKISSTGVVVALILAVTVLFTGCGEPANLEEYIASNDDASKVIESYNQSDANGGMSVDVKENTVTYTYKYNTTFEGATLDAMKTALENAMSDMGSNFTTVGDTLEEESGVGDVTVKVIYLNGDDTEIYSAEY